MEVRRAEVGAEGSMKALHELSMEVHDSREGVRDLLVDGIFPNLMMERWVEVVLDEVREGEVVTFGGIASALGAPRAARAVGELLSQGRVRGPVHRIVRTDGSVPEGSVELLSKELGIPPAHLLEGLPDRVRMVSPFMKDPPFDSLARVQSAMRVFLSSTPPRHIRMFAGIDVSTLGAAQASAIVAVGPDGSEIGKLSRISQPGMPYVSGFLFYKEAPALMPIVEEAIKRGIIEEDAVLVLDGNGTLHPRGMGIACQMGILLDAPSIGVAKKLLVGEVGPEKEVLGGIQTAEVRVDGKVQGHIVQGGGFSRAYVSRGHRMSQKGALESILSLRKEGIKEPTALAHKLSNEYRRLKTPTGPP